MASGNHAATEDIAGEAASDEFHDDDDGVETDGGRKTIAVPVPDGRSVSEAQPRHLHQFGNER